MRNGRIRTLIVLVTAPLCVEGQWLNRPDPIIPRMRDGKPNLSAPAPRRNGKPDLSGVWQVESTSRQELSTLFPPGVGLLPGGENGLGEDDPSKYFLNFLADFKQGQEPLTPAAGKRLMQNLQGGRKPASLCEPPGLPIADLLPVPFKIVQTPGLTLMLYEGDTFFRQIYTDGRKQVVDPTPSWMGYSVGTWEGDTFVVDVTGFNDRAALDAMGHPRSEAMHLTERFRRRDAGHMDVQITVEDLQTFTKPVTINVTHRLLPDTDIFESFCTEGEKDLNHIYSR